MLTIEISGVLALLVGLLIYAMVRTQLRRREVSVLGEAIRPARILIVDDDPDFVEITKKVLDSHGYDTVTASSGSGALRILHYRRRDKWDLVLLDIMMDYITDGLDVRRTMQKDPQLKDIPVVMITSLTGVSRQEMFPSSERIEVSAWLTKPVRAEDLLKTVEETLAGVPVGVPVAVPTVS